MSRPKTKRQSPRRGPVGSSEIVSLRARQADQRAYDYGWDAGKRGPNMVNVHFSLFASKQGTASWQQRYNDAKAD